MTLIRLVALIVCTAAIACPAQDWGPVTHVGDVDGDGDIDVVRREGVHVVVVDWTSEQRIFDTGTTFGVVRARHLGDLDGDGLHEVAQVLHLGAPLFQGIVLVNSIGGGPSWPSIISPVLADEAALEAFGRGLAAGPDLDGDGVREVALSDEVGERLWSLGGGAATPLQTIPFGAAGEVSALGDLDGDGDEEWICGFAFPQGYGTGVFDRIVAVFSGADAAPLWFGVVAAHGFAQTEDGPKIALVRRLADLSNRLDIVDPITGAVSASRTLAPGLQGFRFERSVDFDADGSQDLFLREQNSFCQALEIDPLHPMATLWGPWFPMEDVTNDGFADLMGFGAGNDRGQAWTVTGHGAYGDSNGAQLLFVGEEQTPQYGALTLTAEVPGSSWDLIVTATGVLSPTGFLNDDNGPAIPLWVDPEVGLVVPVVTDAAGVWEIPLSLSEPQLLDAVLFVQAVDYAQGLWSNPLVLFFSG